jgi:broad specificity phosphatase PhoE
MVSASLIARRTLGTLAGVIVLLATLTATPAAPLAAQAATGPTTVIVVRHAEKVDDSRDPVLSEAGVRRAAALADALADAGVQAIYTTHFRRTRDTAAPLAALLQLEPVVIESVGSATEGASSLAGWVREREAGRTVLIVGHSNTVPVIIQALGGPDIGGIEDDEYTSIFIVTIDGSGTRLIRAGYGATAVMH